MAKKAHQSPDRGLKAVRKARQVSQVVLAETIGVAQSEISRLESVDDMMLSTLSNYIAGMGGQLQLLARFGSETMPVSLTTKGPRR